MPSAPRVTLEALVVGLVFVGLFGAVHSADMWARGDAAAMRHASLAAHAFLAGVVGHVAFEVSGVNRWYAKSYK